ncbi:hypothetical protein DCS_07389 [Drechmeria coniospora]|uniref:Mitochondrial integral membrane protein n=1 Tax=Drechmeria coniospora TaxID=98403 RepID=A0A151GEB2_DRECN|nr:hypothetical protein DCS_07389 [Drechmeria coniospora]KYK55426.1 hypothetical protein DCS_07389 [Drechmeria coniospora]ODA81966.1 hypothetical protein RJ55_00471 [Drechmeria coniospora]
MPLFSNAGGNGQEVNDPGSSGGDGDVEQTPDERTRLLPNRVEPYPRAMLTPDDPAVSPYNLWSIRILRYLTVTFSAVTFAWWIVLLVSAFVTPPGLHTRGGNFLAFGYASLTLSNMLLTLLFFGVPSKAVRVLAVVQASLLLLDMILLLCVRQTRYEEGWVGTVSVVWALLMSLWTLLTDRSVQWGKEEEEERLTGRAETRRTLVEWLAVLLSTVGYVVMVVAVALITMTIILRALDSAVAPPGTLYAVDNGQYRIHLHCRGNRTDSAGMKLPTVLLEGGERPVEEHLWAFMDNALKNGSVSRYCFADRPGYGWSDTAPSPLSVGFATDVLGEALAEAGEGGPWILVGAGIGSLHSRVFSSRHGRDVEGLLLIDPLHEDLLGAIATPGRGFLLWLRGILSPLGLDRLSGAIFRGRTSRDRLYGRCAQQNGKFIYAKLQESLVADSFTKRDVLSSRQTQLRNTPLVVISSGLEMKESGTWADKQRDLTTLTDELRHWDIVDRSPHQVWETVEGREQMEKRLRQLLRP